MDDFTEEEVERRGLLKVTQQVGTGPGQSLLRSVHRVASHLHVHFLINLVCVVTDLGFPSAIPTG